MGKGDVKVAIIGDASSLVSALGKSSAASQAFSGVFAGVGMAFGQNLVGMAHSVANFAGDSIQKFMDWGSQVRTIARETGMSFEDSSVFGAVAKASGVAVDDLTNSLKFFDKAIMGNAQSFAQYGIATRDAQGKLRPMNDLIGDTAAVFEELGDGPEAAALAMKLFGRNGMSMLPMLQMGKASLEDLTEAARESGLVLDDEGREKWAAARKASRELSLTWEGLQVQIGQFLVPALTSVTTWAKDTLPGAIDTAKKWLTDHKQDFVNIKDAVVNLWNKLGEWKDWWEKNIGDGEDFARGLKKVDEWLKNINQWIVDHIGTWDDMRHGFMMIGDAASWVGDKLGWLKDHVLDPLIGVIQTLSEVWGGLADKVGNTMFTGVLGFAYNQISGNAQGGFLDDGWSMVGENGPELAYTRGGKTSITPNQQSQGAMAQGAQVVNLTIPVTLGGQNLGTITRRLDLAVT